jgi:hypothetical protein
VSLSKKKNDRKRIILKTIKTIKRPELNKSNNWDKTLWKIDTSRKEEKFMLENITIGKLTL